MRLLDTTSLELKEFAEDAIPAYAILSHTWEEDEVSLQDMLNNNAKTKVGYAKIIGCSKLAAEAGLRYIWVDTCCIDKTSSAELTETINSMYRWYKIAAVCYAYLADVTAKVLGDAAIDEERPEYYSLTGRSGRQVASNPPLEISSFARSRWFTRGWTLQELIAPFNVVFYSKEWRNIGTKAYLKDKLAAITGVDVEILGGADPQAVGVAKRMAWASRRITTREEDIAYCLMGLFGVNMPLLYGEGQRAFLRLQEEIMKSSDDQSLFAWRETSYRASNYYHADASSYNQAWINPSNLHLFRGLLARSPADFIDSLNIAPIRSEQATPYFNTNRGLCIQLPLIPGPLIPGFESDTYLAVLECTDTTDYRGPVGIYLKRLSHPTGNQFARIWPTKFHAVGTMERDCGEQDITKTIYVQQVPPPKRFQGPEVDLVYAFYIPELSAKKKFHLTAVHPENQWNWSNRVLRFSGKLKGIAGVLSFENERSKIFFTVAVGINSSYCPTVHVENGRNFDRWKEAPERVMHHIHGPRRSVVLLSLEDGGVVKVSLQEQEIGQQLMFALCVVIV